MRTPETFNADSIPTPVRPPNTLQPMGEVVTTVFTSANLMAEARQNILPGMYALNAPMIRFVILFVCFFYIFVVCQQPREFELQNMIFLIRAKKKFYLFFFFSPPAPPARTRTRPKPYEQKKIQLPRALQMEIVHLSTSRFTISMDKTKPIDKEGMTLRCKYSKLLLPFLGFTLLFFFCFRYIL